MPRRRERRSGPRTKLLAGDHRKRFMEAVRSGTPIGAAAAYAGVHQATVFRWLQRGEDAEFLLEDEPGTSLTVEQEACLELYREHRSARSQVAVRNLALVQRSAQGGGVVERRTEPDGTVVERFAQGDWRAAQWLLQTSFRSEFGKDAQQVELTGANGGPVQVEGSDTLAALAAAVVGRLEEEESDVMEGEIVETPEIEQ